MNERNCKPVHTSHALVEQTMRRIVVNKEVCGHYVEYLFEEAMAKRGSSRRIWRLWRRVIHSKKR